MTGFDSCNPATGQVASHQGVKEIECLMIDTDYDGSAFFARAVHFPEQSEDRRLKRLKERLGAQLDPERWDVCLSAMRIITRAGAELTTVRNVRQGTCDKERERALRGGAMARRGRSKLEPKTRGRTTSRNTFAAAKE